MAGCLGYLPLEGGQAGNKQDLAQEIGQAQEAQLRVVLADEPEGKQAVQAIGQGNDFQPGSPRRRRIGQGSGPGAQGTEPGIEGVGQSHPGQGKGPAGRNAKGRMKGPQDKEHESGTEEAAQGIEPEKGPGLLRKVVGGFVYIGFHEWAGGLKGVPNMHAGLPKQKFRPLVVLAFKVVGHPGVVGAMRNGQRRLDKNPVLPQV